MVRRLDVARGNGEAPTVKVPAPPQALISNIKHPKGSAGGFVSQRQDQTCGGGGGWKRRWPFAALTSLSHFTSCMYVTSRIISWHYCSSLIPNRGVSTLILYGAAQRGQLRNSLLPLDSLRILLPHKIIEITFPMWQSACFLKMCRNSYSSRVHYRVWNQSLIKHEGSSWGEKKRNNLRLSLQPCNIHLFSWGWKISLSPSTSISPQITGEMMCQSLEANGGLGVGVAGHWTSTSSSVRLETPLFVRSSIRAITSRLAKPFDRERLNVEEGVQ